MPVDVLSSMTFEEHLLEFAERVGVADQSGDTAAIPTSEHDLDKVKRYWNQGYSRFLLADPDWTFCKETIRITTDGTGEGSHNIEQDPARYRLPSYCQGTPRGNWRYVDANSALSECVVLQDRLVDQMRENGSGLTGAPAYAGHRPYSPGEAAGAQPIAWQVLFHPIPDAAYTLQADFRIRRHKLTDLAERTVAGVEHDLTILACALYEWAKYDDDMSGRLKTIEMDMNVLLEASKAIDRKNRPRNLGNLKPTTGEGGSCERRLRVTHFNGDLIT